MSLTLSISRLEDLTDRIRQIELVDPLGNALPDFSAGAHIDIDTGDTGLRSYSLISWTTPPTSPSSYVIAVQREDKGQGGSAFMHALTVGQKLTVTAPKNDFELSDTDAPAVLIAGGIGVTPIVSMAASLRDRSQNFHCHYTGRSQPIMAFANALCDEFGSAISLHTDDESPMDLAAVIDSCDRTAHLYLCGPQGMIEAARNAATAAGFNADQIHLELFSAAVNESGDQAFEVELQSSGQVYQIPAGKTIIEVLEADGVDLVFDCQRGDCGICQTDVISGTPEHRDLVLSDEERASGKVMQICVSRARSKRLVLDI